MHNSEYFPDIYFHIAIMILEDSNEPERMEEKKLHGVTPGLEPCMTEERKSTFTSKLLELLSTTPGQR